MDVTAEISGPVLAAFQHKFGESQADFLAILLGSVSVHNYSENSDLATQTEKSKVRVVVQDWIVVTMEEVMDFKSGKLNKESLQSLVKGTSGVKFVGLLKFKKNSSVDLSFLDRKMMASVLESCSQSDPRPHLYILVGEEVTSTLSIKYNMSTYLLEHKKSCFLGPWNSIIPLAVPNLGTDQRVEYMQGMGGGSKALREMVEGTGLVEACHIDVDKNFQPLNAKFKDSMEQFSVRVSQLEVAKCSLEEEVLVIKRQVEDRLVLSREMKMISGGQWKLTRHISSVHGSIMTYSCQYCDKEFPQQSILTAHTKWHEETNPWQCEECGYRLGSLAHFVKHVRIVHGVNSLDKARALLVATDKYN